MEYRKLTDDKISLLGFGCMRFPVLDNGKIDEDEATKMLDKAIKAGVNYIDTAYPYHNGDSELFVGKVLENYKRDSYYLATKLPMWMVETVDDAVRIFNEQLKRLNKDYVDYYLFHALDKERWDKIKELDLISVFEKIKGEGKIRHLGFSFHDSYDVFEEIINFHNWDFCQIQFNYVDTEVQAGLKGYKLAESKNIPLVIMEPIKGGALAKLPQEVMNEFTSVNKDWSAASWALRYVASFSNVMCILSGMSTMAQVEDNLGTFNTITQFTEKEHLAISNALDVFKKRIKNSCTGCRYCMPCPSGVDIPKNFACWNRMSMFDNKSLVSWSISEMKKNNSTADKCIKCGKCEKLCPQHISIRSDLEKVVKEML